MPMLTALALAAAFALTAPKPQHATDQGIGVDFSTQHARVGDAAEFEFRLRDTASGAPLAAARPAAWLTRRRSDAPAPDCKRQVATYIGADLFNRADIDLNTYFVLSLNDDASISVIDPRFGFGGSQLLDLVTLRSVGSDWALDTEQTQLFVSMPDSAHVAVIDTRRWQVAREIATGPHPQRLAVHGQRMAVADDDGLTLIDTSTLAAKSVHFAAARDLASADDAVFAVAGNSIVRIDLNDAQVRGRTDVDGTPNLIAYSSAAKAAYALDSDTGHLWAIDARTTKTIAQIDGVQPGATQMRFAPNGRFALLANPQRNVVQVLDAATNRIVQNADIDAAPDRIGFTDLIAYVQRRDSESVVLIALDQLGVPGRPISAGDFPAGQHALGRGGLADAVVPTPDEPAVLVANSSDKMVYLYKEGAAAPAGGFSTGGRQPHAAMVVDHGLREHARGDYSTTMPIRTPGLYDVALFVDSPRVFACFTLDVPGADEAQPAHTTRVVAINPPQHLVRGTSTHLKFALLDAQHGEARRADDVRALVFEAPGVWQRRLAAQRSPDDHYEIDFVPPDAGTYYVWIESATLGLDRHNAQFAIYQVD